MCRALCFAALSIALGLAGQAAPAQTVKPGASAGAAPAYRTLTGQISEAASGGQSLTVQVGAGKTAGRAQSWVLGLGKQTLLLRAGRNGQYATIEPGELKKGDALQAVVDLAADPSDHSHRAWWLIVYPPGTTPPAR